MGVNVNKSRNNLLPSGIHTDRTLGNFPSRTKLQLPVFHMNSQRLKLPFVVYLGIYNIKVHFFVLSLKENRGRLQCKRPLFCR